jgi:hypothetical protein
VGGQASDAESRFAAVLRELYEKAGSPPPSELRRQGLDQRPKVTLASSTVDEWLKGISTPSKPDAVMFLVQYLRGKAQRRDGAYQLPSLESRKRLLMDAQAYRRSIRGGRPARGRYPDLRTTIGRTEYQRLGVEAKPVSLTFRPADAGWARGTAG